MTIPVRQCIRQAQMGDVDAITDICKLYNPLIQSMARKYRYLYGNIHDARSIATTAIIECIYAYDLNGNVDVPLAMVTSVLNRFKGETGRYKYEQALFGKSVVCPDGTITDLPLHQADENAVCPVEQLIARETREELERAMEVLDEQERRFFCLRHEEARTFRSMSEEHGIPIPSIQTIIRRSVRKLRRYYGLEGDPPKRVPKKRRRKK